MSQYQIETATLAVADAVKISIRPGGETMRLLDKGHTFHLTTDEANTAARAVLAAIHPTVSTVEELNALPAAAIVRSAQGTIACRHWDNVHGVVFGDDRPFPWERLDLPATVLHTPGGAA